MDYDWYTSGTHFKPNCTFWPIFLWASLLLNDLNPENLQACSHNIQVSRDISCQKLVTSKFIFQIKYTLEYWVLVYVCIWNIDGSGYEKWLIKILNSLQRLDCTSAVETSPLCWWRLCWLRDWSAADSHPASPPHTPRGVQCCHTWASDMRHDDQCCGFTCPDNQQQHCLDSTTSWQH